MGPPNKGHFWSRAFVLFSEVFLWWEIHSFIAISNNYSVICMDPIHEAGNKRSLRYASMISNNITNYWTYNVGVVSWLSVIRGSFAQSWSAGSTKLVLCPESRRSAHGRLLLDSDCNRYRIASVLYREVVL